MQISLFWIKNRFQILFQPLGPFLPAPVGGAGREPLPRPRPRLLPVLLRAAEHGVLHRRPACCSAAGRDLVRPALLLLLLRGLLLHLRPWGDQLLERVIT